MRIRVHDSSIRTLRRPVFYVCGVSGAGKTTLLDDLRPSLPPDRVRLLDFSMLITNELKSESHRWSSLERHEVVEAVSRAAAALNQLGPAIVAGHVFTRIGGRRYVVREAWDQLLPCACVIFLVADEHVVASRRPAMADRVSVVGEDQRFAMRASQRLAAESRTPFLVLPSTYDRDRTRNAETVRSYAMPLLGLGSGE